MYICLVFSQEFSWLTQRSVKGAFSSATPLGESPLTILPSMDISWSQPPCPMGFHNKQKENDTNWHNYRDKEPKPQSHQAHHLHLEGWKWKTQMYGPQTKTQIAHTSIIFHIKSNLSLVPPAPPHTHLSPEMIPRNVSHEDRSRHVYIPWPLTLTHTHTLSWLEACNTHICAIDTNYYNVSQFCTSSLTQKFLAGMQCHNLESQTRN